MRHARAPWSWPIGLTVLLVFGSSAPADEPPPAPPAPEPPASTTPVDKERADRTNAALKSLRDGSAKGVREAKRVEACEELGRIADRGTVQDLVDAAVRDRAKAVRIAATKALRSIGDPSAALRFLPYLESAEVRRRIRALQGLSVFRDRRSVRVLIQRASQIVSGFGRAAVSFTVERAYISGWRLVSGGTGNQVVEVADPEVDVVRTGVSMDVKVRQVELSFVVAILEDLTGQASLGTDPAAWADWLAKNPDFELAPEPAPAVAPPPASAPANN